MIYHEVYCRIIKSGGYTVFFNFSNSFLPGYVLSRKPLVFAAYDYDFLNRASEFDRALKDVESERTVILQLGWQHETEKMISKLSEGIAEAAKMNFNVIILANTPREKELISNAGMKVYYCHQNAFLDERRYPVLPFINKKFDAVYIARITPFKRHQLATEIENLYLIGAYSEREKDYALSTLEAFPTAKKVSSVSSYCVPFHLAKANCGLCLSETEGAMFVSMEYLLCGLPVVNTPNTGGRDLMMPDFAVKNVASNPCDVARAVLEWKNERPAPKTIRNAVLELMKPHRATLVRILTELGVNDELCKKYAKRFPHKLGIRTKISPFARMRHGISVKLS